MDDPVSQASEFGLRSEAEPSELGNRGVDSRALRNRDTPHQAPAPGTRNRGAQVRAKRSVAVTSSCVIPGSSAEWPASGTTWNAASGQARCRSQADIMGHTTS